MNWLSENYKWLLGLWLLAAAALSLIGYSSTFLKNQKRAKMGKNACGARSREAKGLRNSARLTGRLQHFTQNRSIPRPQI